MTYIIQKYDNEKDNPILYIDKTTILDVRNLKSASTVFLNKLIDSKEKIVVINLKGQPKQIFDICDIGKVVFSFKSLEEAEKFLEDK